MRISKNSRLAASPGASSAARRPPSRSDPQARPTASARSKRIAKRRRTMRGGTTEENGEAAGRGLHHDVPSAVLHAFFSPEALALGRGLLTSTEEPRGLTFSARL